MKHSKGEPHICAKKMEADLAVSRRDGGIRMTLQRGVSQRKVFIVV